MMRSWRTVALERYDRDASRYHQGVYKRKRADLIVSLNATLSPLFLGQLKNLHKACLGAFKKDILEGMKGEEYNFADVVSKAKAKCDNRFTTGAKESVVDDSEEGKTEWNWEEELELLREEVQSVADQCRKDETKKMVNTIEVSLFEAFAFFSTCSRFVAEFQEADFGTNRVGTQQRVA